MEYPVIKGLEDPVKIRGFLLHYFYVVLGTGIFSLLFILSSIRDVATEQSVTPLVRSIVFALLLFSSVAWGCLKLSNRKKFPPMGKTVRGSNLELLKRLEPNRNHLPHVSREQLIEMEQLLQKMKAMHNQQDSGQA